MFLHRCPPPDEIEEMETLKDEHFIPRTPVEKDVLKTPKPPEINVFTPISPPEIEEVETLQEDNTITRPTIGDENREDEPLPQPPYSGKVDNPKVGLDGIKCPSYKINGPVACPSYKINGPVDNPKLTQEDELSSRKN